MPLCQISFSVNTQSDAEAVVEVLEHSAALPFSSFAILPGAERQWRIEALFDGDTPDVRADVLVNEIRRALGDRASMGGIEVVPDRDWVSHTLTTLTPVMAGPFLVHGSHHDTNTLAPAISIKIDAGLAFGTGHHETTRGCLELLADLARKQKRIHALDMGCGSGILAIAIAKLTRCKVLGTDIDPIAISVSQENAKANYVAPLVDGVAADGTHHPEIRCRAPYDLIVANILASPLKRLAIEVDEILHPSGNLIVSGLLSEQEAGVLSRYRQFGFHLKKRYTLGDWPTLLLSRTD